VIHLKFIAFKVDASKERILCKRVISKNVFAPFNDLVYGAALLMLAA
jgi:hypothetical protein